MEVAGIKVVIIIRRSQFLGFLQFKMDFIHERECPNFVFYAPHERLAGRI